MDHYISMYIDNELSLDEKILFVKQCRGENHYADEALSLLKQEKELNAVVNKTPPEVEFVPSHRSQRFLSTSALGWAIAACLLVLVSFTVMREPTYQLQQEAAHRAASQQSLVPYRFVIQQHDKHSVEITGSFTEWQPVPLSPTGSNGYWELNLNLPEGEHRYTYIINGSTYLPDPTVPNAESDDFGSANSILKIKA